LLNALIQAVDRFLQLADFAPQLVQFGHDRWRPLRPIGALSQLPAHPFGQLGEPFGGFIQAGSVQILYGHLEMLQAPFQLFPRRGWTCRTALRAIFPPHFARAAGSRFSSWLRHLLPDLLQLMLHFHCLLVIPGTPQFFEPGLQVSGARSEFLIAPRLRSVRACHLVGFGAKFLRLFHRLPGLILMALGLQVFSFATQLEGFLSQLVGTGIL